MFVWSTATRIDLALGATDLRQGFDGLYALVEQRLELDPLSGDVFVFANRRRSRLKLLFWDGGRPHSSGLAERPRRERLPACPPEEQHCPQCGAARVVIGYETSEQLDVEPARYFVLVTKREKRACPRCSEAGVAPTPARRGPSLGTVDSDRQRFAVAAGGG